MENDQKKAGELKHLGFLRAASLTVLLWLSTVYDNAKNHSGPLKPAVSSVEAAVDATLAPLFHKLPLLLSFLDQKVDEASVKLEEHTPAMAKKAAMKAAQTAREILRQGQVGGPWAAARYAASESKELAVKQSVVMWAKLDRVPPFHAVAEMAVPAAAHWSDKYNRVVIGMTRKGYKVFGYLPLVPIDDIAKAFKQAQADSPAVNEVDAE